MMNLEELDIQFNPANLVMKVLLYNVPRMLAREIELANELDRHQANDQRVRRVVRY